MQAIHCHRGVSLTCRALQFLREAVLDVLGSSRRAAENGRSGGRIPHLLLLGVTFVALSCSNSSETNSIGPAIRPTSYEFADRYELIDSVRLQQPDTAPLAGLSALAVSNDGSIIAGDGSESNLKIYGRDGHLLRVVPDLKNPIALRLDAAGDIYAAEPSPPLIHRFSRAGEFKTTITIPAAYVVNDFLLLSGGRILAAVQGKYREAVVQLDTSGQIQEKYLDGRRLRASSNPQAEIWDYTRRQTLGWVGRHIEIASAVADSLWELDLDAGTITAHAVAFAEREIPQAPRQPLRRAEEVLRWLHQFHVVPAVFSNQELLAIPFVKGSLIAGDPTVLLLRRQGAWEVLRHSPAVLAVRDSLLVARLRRADTTYILGYYRPRHDLPRQ